VNHITSRSTGLPLLIRIREVPEIGYPDWRFSWFSCFGFSQLEGASVSAVCFWTVRAGMHTLPLSPPPLYLSPSSELWSGHKLDPTDYVPRLHPVNFQNFVWPGYFKIDVSARFESGWYGIRDAAYRGKTRIFGLVLLCLILGDFGPRRGRRLVFRLTYVFSTFGVLGQRQFFFVLCHIR
jgi:hypothetical protein